MLTLARAVLVTFVWVLLTFTKQARAQDEWNCGQPENVRFDVAGKDNLDIAVTKLTAISTELQTDATGSQVEVSVTLSRPQSFAVKSYLRPNKDTGRLGLYLTPQEEVEQNSYVSVEYDGIPGQSFLSRIPGVGEAFEVVNPFVGNIQISPPTTSALQIEATITPRVCVGLFEMSKASVAYRVLWDFWVARNKDKNLAKKDFEALLLAHDVFVKGGDSNKTRWRCWVTDRLMRDDFEIYVRPSDNKPFVMVRTVNVANESICPYIFAGDNRNDNNGNWFPNPVQEAFPNVILKTGKMPETKQTYSADKGFSFLGVQFFRGTQTSTNLQSILSMQQADISAVAKVGRAIRGYRTLVKDGKIYLDGQASRASDQIMDMAVNKMPFFKFSEANQSIKDPFFDNPDTIPGAVAARAMCGIADTNFPFRFCEVVKEPGGPEACLQRMGPSFYCAECAPPATFQFKVDQYLGLSNQPAKNLLGPLTLGTAQILDNMTSYADALAIETDWSGRSGVPSRSLLKGYLGAIKDMVNVFAMRSWCNSSSQTFAKDADPGQMTLAGLSARPEYMFNKNGLHFGPTNVADAIGWSSYALFPAYIGWFTDPLTQEMVSRQILQGDRLCLQATGTVLDQETPKPRFPSYEITSQIGPKGDAATEHMSAIKVLYKYGQDVLSGKFNEAAHQNRGTFCGQSAFYDQANSLSGTCLLYYLGLVAKDIYGNSSNVFASLREIVKSLDTVGGGFAPSWLWGVGTGRLIKAPNTFPKLPSLEDIAPNRRAWISWPFLTVMEQFIWHAVFEIEKANNLRNWYVAAQYDNTFDQARRVCETLEPGSRLASMGEYFAASGPHSPVSNLIVPPTGQAASWSFWTSNVCFGENPQPLVNFRRPYILVAGHEQEQHEKMMKADVVPGKAWVIRFDRLADGSRGALATCERADILGDKRFALCVLGAVPAANEVFTDGTYDFW